MRIALILLSLGSPAPLPLSVLGRLHRQRRGLGLVAGRAQKARLAAPVVNPTATPRTGTRSPPPTAAGSSPRATSPAGSRFSWFKVWEPDGTSTVEGPLNYPGGWSATSYPLGFDVTADGAHMVYGYSNSSCCPTRSAEAPTCGRSAAARSRRSPSPASEEPTLFGSRVIAHSGSTINVQDAGDDLRHDFAPWLDVAGTGLELRRTDVAANGHARRARGSSSGTAGRRRSARSACSRSTASTRRPTRARSTATCPPAGVAERRLALPGRALDRLDRR